MTKLKICGITQPCEIDVVNEAMPDYIGFVFAESRRQVTIDHARSLKARLSPSIPAVGVFVDEPPEHIIALLEEGLIDIAQLHGQEPAEDILLIQHTTGKPVIKAVRVKNAEALALAQTSPADFLLLDSGAGSGKTFDWSLTGQIKRPFFLAGGLNETNLPAALLCGAYALDLSSGAETDGRKDSEKIRRIVSLVRAANLNQERS